MLYYWCFFFLVGFGYVVDFMVIFIKSVILLVIINEFNSVYSKGILVVNNVGLIFGVLFWGFFVDMIGCKWVFNFFFIICLIFGLVVGVVYVIFFFNDMFCVCFV